MHVDTLEVLRTLSQLEKVLQEPEKGAHVTRFIGAPVGDTLCGDDWCVSGVAATTIARGVAEALVRERTRPVRCGNS